MATEHDDQKAVVSWIRKFHPHLVVAAIPNGEQRSKTTGVKLKAEGVLAGIPDLIIAMPNGGSIWLEMKTKSGKISTVQKEIHSRLNVLGHTVVVGYGAQDAIKQLVEIFKLQSATIQHLLSE
jgi:hypothetical protein